MSYSSIFLAFSKIGLCGFGGVAAWAHRVLVDERGWYTDKQYADLLSVGSVLPGPNVCNISIMVGDQFRGALGSLTALGGLLAGPLLILIVLATLYETYGGLPLVQAVIGGVTAAAAGLVIGTVIKLARRLRASFGNILVGLLAFAAAAILHLHVLLIVAVMVPLSLALTIRERRR
ncbi:MAG TPA: chromate transporter [Dongiaceae bacterium]|nr:chromate transporter [Dongiaceae bacterium]